MARNIKVCEYWIEIPDGGTRRYICPLDDGTPVLPIPSATGLCGRLPRNGERSRPASEQYGECYEFGSGMVELDPKAEIME